MFNAMLAGAIAMGSLVASLFFLRFWKSTRDRFFLYFALSFLMEAGSRLMLGLSALQDEETPVYFLIRLAAYALILFAVLEKNRPRRRR